MGKHLRDAKKEAFWRKLIGEHVQSGMTVVVFCESRGLALSSYYWWKRRIEKRDMEESAASARSMEPVFEPFAEVRITPSESCALAAGRTGDLRSSRRIVPIENDVGAIDLFISNGHALRLAPGFDEGTLLRLIALLDSGHC